MDETSDIKATVQDIDGEHAVLEVGGQPLRWPAGQLPANIKKGDTLVLRALTERQSTVEPHERARAILTEILGGRP